jgi:hypothetical protein
MILQSTGHNREGRTRNITSSYAGHCWDNDDLTKWPKYVLAIEIKDNVKIYCDMDQRWYD